MSPSPRTIRAVADAVAAAFLAGRAWNPRALADRARPVLWPRPSFLPAVAREVVAAYPRPPRDRPRELAAFVALVLEAHRDWIFEARPRVVRRRVAGVAMGRRRWPVPVLDTVGDVAAWLELPVGELEWFADVRGLERRADDERLRHYRYAWHVRPDGRARVLEAPKPRLKALQRRLLHELLAWIPVHDAAHGFVAGRSARSHAALHVGRDVVLRLDLEDCFASVSAGRVYGLFRATGYAEGVAHVLTGLCTNAMPVDEWARVPRPMTAEAIAAHHRLGRRLAAPHLPQGAPSSPALANLSAFRLDRRLAALAASLDARYSRYADDLVLSGDGRLRAPWVRSVVASIASEEGFRVNLAKTNLMTRAGRQRVAGIVVNDRVNLARDEYDALKAILHDAEHHGLAAANRTGHPEFRAHLRGRIAWLESLHPARGAHLRERLARLG
jgi:RNA-directed DNA polymerase